MIESGTFIDDFLIQHYTTSDLPFKIGGYMTQVNRYCLLWYLNIQTVPSYSSGVKTGFYPFGLLRVGQMVCSWWQSIVISYISCFLLPTFQGSPDGALGCYFGFVWRVPQVFSVNFMDKFIRFRPWKWDTQRGKVCGCPKNPGFIHCQQYGFVILDSRQRIELSCDF